MVMRVIQAEDLSPNTFSNANTAKQGGIDLRTDSGSTLGQLFAAIGTDITNLNSAVVDLEALVNSGVGTGTGVPTVTPAVLPFYVQTGVQADADAPLENILWWWNGTAWLRINDIYNALPNATESAKGIAEIATQPEVDAGTDDTRIVTPLKLKNYVADNGGKIPVLSTDLGGVVPTAYEPYIWIDDTTTPHSVMIWSFAANAFVVAGAAGSSGPLIPPTSFSNSSTFNYTGAVQSFLIPAGATWIKVETMAAGGGSPGSISDAVGGGAGGFASGVFHVSDIAAGALSVVVGGAGKSAGVAGWPYAGAAFIGDGAGGGLSGVFDGLGGIMPTISQNTNALVVAGGGSGAADWPSGTLYRTQGAQGGDPSNSGGSATMQADGWTSNPGHGGGSGYSGGSFVSGTNKAKAGTNFVKSTAYVSENLYNNTGTWTNPKGETTPWSGVGKGGRGDGGDVYGQNGRVIISWD